MPDAKLERLKNEASRLKQLLSKETASCSDAQIALTELDDIFNTVKSMNKYQAIGRIRLDRIFIEGDLANNNELADCYSRFANLAEGLEV